MRQYLVSLKHYRVGMEWEFEHYRVGMEWEFEHNRVGMEWDCWSTVESVWNGTVGALWSRYGVTNCPCSVSTLNISKF